MRVKLVYSVERALSVQEAQTQGLILALPLTSPPSHVTSVSQSVTLKKG